MPIPPFSYDKYILLLKDVNEKMGAVDNEVILVYNPAVHILISSIIL